MWLFPREHTVLEYCIYIFVAHFTVYLIFPRRRIKYFYPFGILTSIEISLMIYGAYLAPSKGLFHLGELGMMFYPLVLACIQWPISLICAIYFRVKYIKEMDAKRLEEIKKRKQQKRAKPNKH